MKNLTSENGKEFSSDSEKFDFIEETVAALQQTITEIIIK